MADTTETLTQPQSEALPRRARPVRRAWMRALWSMVVGLTVFVVVAVGLIAGLGRAVNAPDWMRAELAVRAENSVDGAMRFAFGDISLVVGEGWRPRVHFRDLTLRELDGREILRLSDAEVSFSISALLRGEILPKSVLLTGVFATLRKDRDGAIALSVGDNAQPLEQAQSLPGLIERWDAALEQPILSSLSTLEVQALTLRYEDARAGRAWTVDGGRVVADRSGQDLRLSGTFSLLSGRDYAATIEANYSSRIGEIAGDFGVSVTDIAAEDIATQSVALAWLEILRAPISGAFRGSVGAEGALGPVNATLQIGSGVLQPTDVTRPIPFTGARTYFTYTPEDQKLAFDEMSVESTWMSGLAEGIAYLNGVENGSLTDLVGQFKLSRFRLNPDGLYAEPMEIPEATADFRLSLQPFKLNLGQLQVQDGDSQILLSGSLLAEDDGWNVALDSWIDRLTPERLLELWPESAAPKPREWLSKNLLAGLLHGMNFAFRSRPGMKPDLYLDFDYSDASVRFAKWLPPLTDANGTATLVDRRFVSTANSGVVDSGGYGLVDASGTSFIIPDVSIKPAAPGIVRVEADGPVAAVLALLNRPPVSILKNSVLPVDLAQGRARASGTMALPLKKGTKFHEIDFHLSGRVENVDSTVLVRGHRITAEALDLNVRPDKVTLQGQAAVSGVPVTAKWVQPLGEGAPKSSKLTGTVELSERTVEAFKIGLPPGSVSGEGEGRIDIALAAGQLPRLSLSSDLAGVGLAIPSLGWAKPAKSKGALRLSATLGSQPVVDELALQAAGLIAEGKITTRADGGLDRAAFSSVRIGNWFSAPVDLLGQGPGNPVAMQIRGGKLDMRLANFGPSGGEAGPMDIALSSLRITETIELRDFKGQFRGGRGLSGPFTGLLGGRTPVTGDVTPQDGRSAFRIRSDDAGGVLRDAGLLTQARGGDFSMTLVPVDGPGNYDGVGQIRNTRVINAPAIAALLDAASIVGLIDELAGSGILFAEVEARFRLSPDRMTVYESSAVGPSMGLSMDGHYDLGDDRLAMQGVISPIYLINGIGAVLTRKGEGLIGFNYELSGSAANPRVQVNPLSALAPGMLREVMRAPPPENPNAPVLGAGRSNPGTPDPLDGSTGGR